MSPDQIGDLLNFLILALPLIYRVLIASRKNTPAATEVRLTNGHAKENTGEHRLVVMSLEDQRELTRRNTEDIDEIRRDLRDFKLTMRVEVDKVHFRVDALKTETESQFEKLHGEMNSGFAEIKRLLLPEVTP